MHGRNAFGQQFAALGGAPLDADAADGLLVAAGLPDLFGEFHGKVDGEGFRENLDLSGGGKGLEERLLAYLAFSMDLCGASC